MKILIISWTAKQNKTEIKSLEPLWNFSTSFSCSLDSRKIVSTVFFFENREVAFTFMEPFLSKFKTKFVLFSYFTLRLAAFTFKVVTTKILSWKSLCFMNARIVEGVLSKIIVVDACGNEKVCRYVFYVRLPRQRRLRILSFAKRLINLAKQIC